MKQFVVQIVFSLALVMLPLTYINCYPPAFDRDVRYQSLITNGFEHLENFHVHPGSLKLNQAIKRTGAIGVDIPDYILFYKAFRPYLAKLKERMQKSG